MKEIHLRLAEIGLRVASRYGFALAGGYAVQVYGILDRPSEDVDLFTAWERRGEFAVAVDAVVDAYCGDGYTVEVMQQFDTFARLAVTDPAVPDHPYKVELAANWRARPPVTMDIGPVLHIDDVIAGKMSALFTRAEPRDFLDIDAALKTGRYTREQLLELAEQADAGFDRRVLADLFAMLQRYPDRRFAAYAPTPTTSPPCENASRNGARSFSPTSRKRAGSRSARQTEGVESCSYATAHSRRSAGLPHACRPAVAGWPTRPRRRPATHRRYVHRPRPR